MVVGINEYLEKDINNKQAKKEQLTALGNSIQEYDNNKIDVSDSISNMDLYEILIYFINNSGNLLTDDEKQVLTQRMTCSSLQQKTQSKRTNTAVLHRLLFRSYGKCVVMVKFPV